MRARGAATTTRPSARPCQGEAAGRRRLGRRQARPALPEHSTFRRVAVFVPLER